jgi:hypothetical protein
VLTELLLRLPELIGQVHRILPREHISSFFNVIEFARVSASQDISPDRHFSCFGEMGKEIPRNSVVADFASGQESISTSFPLQQT